MKNSRIVQAIGNIDEELVAGAMAAKKRSPLRRWSAVAACLAVLLLAGAAVFPLLSGENNDGVWVGGLIRPYADRVVRPTEGEIVWRWEEQTIFEQYTAMIFNGCEYQTRGREVDATLLGDSLGTCRAIGYDVYTDQTFRDNFEVRTITGVSEELLVAVNMDGAYYVFIREEGASYATLGALMDGVDLAGAVTLDRFSVYAGYSEKGYYALAADDPIWQILSECRGAERLENDAWGWKDKDYVSFTVTSETLGVYKKVLYISEDGILWTNALEEGCGYAIGADAAGAIIQYAKEHGMETEREPYTYSLAGTLTEIGDGYILVDDSVLCADPEDGVIFKVLTEDIRIRRYVERGAVAVGDTVVVEFTAAVDAESGNLIDSAYNLSQAVIMNGNVAIPE